MASTVYDQAAEGPFGPEPRHELRRALNLNEALAVQVDALASRCERLQDENARLRRELDAERRDSEAALEWMEAA